MDEPQPEGAPGRAWGAELAAWLAVLAVAAAARFWDLDLKPLHSDESMNGFFMRRLLEEGIYQYKPSDFHGPLLYLASWLPMWLAGPSDWSLRFATACAGVATVVSLWLYRPWIGRAGALAAAALLAVSAPDVYFARTCIHETWFVLCLSLAGAFSLRALCGGVPRDFAAAGIAWACAAATKETVVISAAAFAAALITALLPGLGEPLAPGAPRDLRALPGWLARRRRELLLAAAVAAAVLALLFTSFFSYPRGLVAMFEAAHPWLGYGTSGRNQGRPPGYFVGLAAWWAPVLMTAAWGALLGLARRSRFAVLAAVWFAASLLVYELIPYKTPWCALAIALPLFPLAGYGVRALGEAPGRKRRAVAAIAAAVTLAAGLAEGARATWDASFVRYDDPRVPFVYAQTLAPFMDLVDDLEQLRSNRKRAEGADAETQLFAIEPKNPLRWYLYTRGWPDASTVFQSRWPRADRPQRTARVQAQLERAEIVMVADFWEREVRQRLDAGAFARHRYPARPGSEYVLFVHDDLARYWPRGGRTRIDGGGDPLAHRSPAPASFLCFGPRR